MSVLVREAPKQSRMRVVDGGVGGADDTSDWVGGPPIKAGHPVPRPG